ncbi:hypothetical protein Sa4125_15460 [Aureimonas sp. SA4125]|nr:hypothetical protein Sa4125_15460 [Aureimonas sp. SA4125]
MFEDHSHGALADFRENLFVVLLVMAPVSQELEPPANPRRFTPRLVGVLGIPRQTTQARTIEIGAKWNGRRHGKPPFATMIQIRTSLGIPYESDPMLAGMNVSIPHKLVFDEFTGLHALEKFA